MTEGRHARALTAALLGAAMIAGSPTVVAGQETPAQPSATETAPSTDAGATPPGGATPAQAAPEALTPSSGSSGPARPLVVTSWGGVYTRSQEEAVFRPFTRATGIEVSRKIYAGDLDSIRELAASGEPVWDVVDVEPADAEEGCNEGLFQKLSFVLSAAPDGTAAINDFLPGTLHPCAVGSLAWSMTIAHLNDPEDTRTDDARPASLLDFFDLDRFPGRRGLRRTPMVNLEWALLADGAAPAEVYDLLRTEAGVERAFAKLDSLRDEIVWWDDSAEPARLLANAEVVMTSTFNAPMFNEIAIRKQPFALIWDRQVWDIDLWAIPAAAANRQAAQEFVRYATAPERLARQTRWIAYGPVRRSSLALVGDHVHAEVEMGRFLPTSEENFATALRNDALFWRQEGPALVERFNAWMAR